jgi:pimeloyl-ACP methyl ester carboxylesterase
MKLFCRKLGEGDPVIILHGLFGLSDNWLSIGKQLAPMYRCYLLDMRNHGRSPHSKDLIYEDMVEDIYEFLTDFGLRTVSILGHSMGGMTAMKFALEYPHRINKLVIVDIAPKSYPALHHNILEGLLAIPIKKLNSRAEADMILKNYVSSPKVRQFLLKNIYRKEDQSYTWRLNIDAISRHSADIGKSFPQNKTFDKPTLFIRGEKSDYILKEDEQRIKEIFPLATILTIGGATHWVHAEKPEAFLKAIRSFI